jgi:predicted kinase
VPPLERLGPEGYTSQVSRRVYATLAERASLIVRAGHSAIVDAVHTHAADRAAIEHVAAAASVPFVGVWLEAPESILITRTAQRTRDASDADAAVIRQQSSQDTGTMRWWRLDASGPAAAVLDRVLDRIRHTLPDAA